MRLHRGKLRWYAVAMAIAASLLVGCGSGSDYANQPRPPMTILVSAAVFPTMIVLSPEHFGAGQINLVVTNQTHRTIQLVLETASPPGSGQPGERQQLGPINPQATASLKANLTRGPWQLRVSGGTPPAAALIVGRQRPSSQNQLLLP